jgi:hypothetical protein
MGQPFLPIVFESHGLAEKMFLQHFDKLITRRADEIGALMAPLKIYWSRKLSLTLQRSVAQAINIRMASLYAGPASPTAADESAWPGVVAGQMQASTGNSAWERKAKEKEHMRDLSLLISLFFMLYFSLSPSCKI